MAGTNEFAFFRCKSICTGGGPESGRKKFEKCLPAGTGTKIYFSSIKSDAITNFREEDGNSTESAWEKLLSGKRTGPS